jgi:hypothetical protein
MTKTKPPDKRPVRLPRIDYVRAFCLLNEDYIQHWKKIRKWFDREVYPYEPVITPSRGGKRNVSLDKRRVKRGKGWVCLPHPDSAKCSEEINEFLARWPQLRHPIPPEEGAKHPEKYLWCLCPVVELIKEKQPEGKRGMGKLIRSASGLRGVFTGDVTGSRYIKVKIDLFGSPEEITKEVMALVNDHRALHYPSLGIFLPIPDAKVSVPRTKDDYPRSVLETYAAAGERSIKKTAEILHPEIFDYKSDRRRAKVELDEWLEERGGRREAQPKIVGEYENEMNRIEQNKQACSETRRKERANCVRGVRAIIAAYKMAIM